MSRLATVTLPDFGMPERLPEQPASEHLRRLDGLRARMREAQLDVVVVYADREHAANLQYLTGFDPRFEEALLLVGPEDPPRLLVGNECMGYLPDAALGLDVELWQDLSLPGQARDTSRPLATILAAAGVRPGRRVGGVGWKTYTAALVGDPPALDLPAYLVDHLRRATGDLAAVVNATGLLNDAEQGLRTTLDPVELARMEYAACHTSASLRAAIGALAEGVQEHDVARRLHGGGLPHSCHPMVGFGDKARRGLASPSNRTARRGDVYTIAFGVAGALNCRAGLIATGPEALDEPLRAFYPEFVGNYADTVHAWYRHVRVGARAGDVWAAVEAVRDDRLFRLAVNPGHCIHTDEWVDSPFVADGRVVLRSGMALQMDIIPVSQGPFCYSNLEDGVLLADAALREALAARFPAMMSRIAARREFMASALGIALDPSVLPVSNIPGWLPPYALAPERVVVAG